MRARLNAITACASQAALAARPGGQVRGRAVLEFGDHLLDHGVVALLLVGLDGAQGRVRDEPVMAVGREQLALFGAVPGQWLESFDPAHHQPAGHVIGLAGAR